MVRSKCKSNNPLLGFSISVMIAIITITALMRFPRDDRPTLPVKPQHYKIEIITKEDYKQLSNPENRAVDLSNNTTQTKAETSDPYLLPYYKSINDGSEYVLVSIRQNATFMKQWYGGILPIFCMCFVGLFWGFKRTRLDEVEKRPDSNQAEEEA